MVDPSESEAAFPYVPNVRSRFILMILQWEERLLTMDPTSMAHILKRTDIYEKPALSRRHIADLIGTGMLSAEGQVYRRQRRVILPAFSNHNLRGTVPVVLKKGQQLVGKWKGMMKGGSEKLTLEMASWINRVTFDIIGLTGPYGSGVLASR